MNMHEIATLHSAHLQRMNESSHISEEEARHLVVGMLCTGAHAEAKQIASKLNPHYRFSHPLVVAPVESVQKITSVIVSDSKRVITKASSKYSFGAEYDTDPVLSLKLRAEWVPGWDFVISDGAVIDGTGYLPLDLSVSRRPHFYAKRYGVVAYERPTSIKHVDEDILYLSAPIDGHIGHWIIDFLPRLLGDLDKKMRVAVPSNLTKKHIHMLEAVGCSYDRLLFCHPEYLYSFKNLNVFVPGRAMPPNPTHVQFIRRGFFNGNTPSSGKRIFLSRENVGTRLAVNQDELETFLNKFGIMTIDMGDLSFADQKYILSDAEAIIGGYGSDLLALYSTPPGCSVVVLMDNQRDNQAADPNVAHLCSLLGMTHQILNCETVSPSKAALRMKKDNDFIVNIAELQNRLGLG